MGKRVKKKQIDPRLKQRGWEPCYYFDLWLSTHHGILNGSWLGLRKINEPFMSAKIGIHFMGGRWYSNFILSAYRLRIALYFNNER